MEQKDSCVFLRVATNALFMAFPVVHDVCSVCSVWSEVMMPVCAQLVPETSAPSLSLTGDTDFTLSPHVASTMLCRQSLMVHPRLHSVSLDALSRDGFDGWWSPMEKLWGCMHLGDCNVLLVRTTAWDGAPGGRLQAIMRDTPPQGPGAST